LDIALLPANVTVWLADVSGRTAALRKTIDFCAR
jgi:hypothetical protein